MKNILVANAKGGSGKTTLVTNLAGYFAAQGKNVALADLDRQRSSTQWINRRPAVMPTIHAYNSHHKQHAAKPDWIITDSPAGFRGEKLTEAVKAADCVIVPVMPSAFDIAVASDFLDVLEQEKSVRKHKTFVALVGMRVNMRANSTAALTQFMEYTGLEILTYLRHSQVYVTAAELGVSIFDLRPSFVAQDLAQWMPLLEWIEQATSDTP